LGGVRATLKVIVLGVGDVGSAIAVALVRQGHQVVLVDGPQPTTTRRKMAFADAIFDGQATLDGISAIRVDAGCDLEQLLARDRTIPVVVDELPGLLAQVRPDVLIDARMRKRVQPASQRGLAPLTIGLGPNFVAGDTVDAAIETEWGDALGSVITAGATQPLRGEPRAIADHARERYVDAPMAGIFRTDCSIGDQVAAGQLVAHIGEEPLRAPLTGTLRGLTRDGIPVDVSTKVIEVDPRLNGAVIAGVGERPA
jgi:xanthine dehydrogenase accessory factor